MPPPFLDLILTTKKVLLKSKITIEIQLKKISKYFPFHVKKVQNFINHFISHN